jgi:hypothetical protein
MNLELANHLSSLCGWNFQMKHDFDVDSDNIDIFFQSIRVLDYHSQYNVCKEIITGGYGKCFPRFPEAIRNSIEFCKFVLQKGYNHFDIMSDEIRNNKEICILAVSINAWEIENMSDDMRNDEDICVIAASKCGETIKFMNNANKNNKKICLLAAKNIGESLRFMSEEMKNDFDVCIVAITQDYRAIKYVSVELKNNYEFCLKAINCAPSSSVFIYFSDNIKNNYEICKIVCKRYNNTVPRYIPDAVRNNVKFASSVLASSPFANRWPNIIKIMFPIFTSIKNLAAFYSSNEEFFNYGQNDKMMEYIYSNLIESYDRGSPRTT